MEKEGVMDFSKGGCHSLSLYHLPMIFNNLINNPSYIHTYTHTYLYLYNKENGFLFLQNPYIQTPPYSLKSELDLLHFFRSLSFSLYIYYEAVMINFQSKNSKRFRKAINAIRKSVWQGNSEGLC